MKNVRQTIGKEENKMQNTAINARINHTAQKESKIKKVLSYIYPGMQKAQSHEECDNIYPGMTKAVNPTYYKYPGMNGTGIAQTAYVYPGMNH